MVAHAGSGRCLIMVDDGLHDGFMLGEGRMVRRWTVRPLARAVPGEDTSNGGQLVKQVQQQGVRRRHGDFPVEARILSLIAAPGLTRPAGCGHRLPHRLALCGRRVPGGQGGQLRFEHQAGLHHVARPRFLCEMRDIADGSERPGAQEGAFSHMTPQLPFGL